MPRSADARRLAVVEKRLVEDMPVFTSSRTGRAAAVPSRLLVEAFFRAITEGPARRATLGMPADLEAFMPEVSVSASRPDVEVVVARALGARIVGKAERAKVLRDEDDEEELSEEQLEARVRRDIWLADNGFVTDEDAPKR